MAPVLLKDDFLVYKSGVYTPTDNANQQYGANGEPIIHAVTIMGWGRSEGTPYWLVGRPACQLNRSRVSWMLGRSNWFLE